MCRSISGSDLLRAAIACTTAGGWASAPRPSRGQQALQCRGAQCLRGAIPGSPGSIQPTATFDRLRRADHHGQVLGDQRPDPAALPQRDERHGQPQLDDHPAHVLRNQVENLSLGRRSTFDVLRCEPDQTRMPTGQVHRQRGISGPQQSTIRHELGTPEHGHTCGRRPGSGPARRRSSSSRLRRRQPGRCSTARSPLLPLDSLLAEHNPGNRRLIRFRRCGFPGTAPRVRATWARPAADRRNRRPGASSAARR